MIWEQAARVTFQKIIIPLSLPGVISGIIMVFIPSISEFVVADILGGSKVLLFGNVIDQEFNVANNWNLGSGLSIVLMIFIFISMAIMNRHASEEGDNMLWIKAKSFIEKFYVAFIGFLLYAPLLVLFVCSFNDSKSRTVWGGFTLHWYTDLFQNEEVLSAVRTSLLLTTLAALIATLIGTLACIGMTAMKLRFQKVMEGLSNIPLLNADIVTGVAIMLLFVHFMSLGFTSMLIAHVTLGLPYIILNVMPRFQQLDKNVYEAAQIRCIRSIRLCQSCPAGNYPGNPFRIFLCIYGIYG